MTTGLALAIAVALVFVNACFVAAEFAVVSVRRSRIDAMARSGNRRAKVLRRVLGDLDSHLSAGQIMITAAAIGVGWLGQPAVAELLSPLFDSTSPGAAVIIGGTSLAISFGAITAGVLVAGEITPKLLGLRRAESVALWMAVPLHWVTLAARPILGLLHASSSGLLTILGVGRSEQEGVEPLDPEELRDFIKQSETFGRLSFTRRRLLENAIEFTDHTARQIMVPRDQIDWLNLDQPLSETLRLVNATGHTRYPLCRGSLDTVVGMIHIKDLFLKRSTVKTPSDLMSIQRDMLVVPESQPIDVLQRTFQRKRAHMAMVVDEYGVPTGLVTLEDVLEELVGEIRDEFDEEEKPKLVRGEEEVLVDGMLLVEDLCRELGIELEEGEDDTVGGYVTTGLGKIARVGDSFKLGEYDGRVVEMEGRRIARVSLTPAAAEDQETPPLSRASGA